MSPDYGSCRMLHPDGIAPGDPHAEAYADARIIIDRALGAIPVPADCAACAREQAHYLVRSMTVAPRHIDGCPNALPVSTFPGKVHRVGPAQLTLFS